MEGEPSTSKAHINLVSNEKNVTTSDLNENYYVNSNVQFPKDTSDDESNSSSSESSSSSSALVDSDDSVKDKDYVPESELLGTTEKDQSNDSDEYSEIKVVMKASSIVQRRKKVLKERETHKHGTEMHRKNFEMKENLTRWRPRITGRDLQEQ